MGSTTLSANTLALNSGPTTYNRTAVFVNGTISRASEVSATAYSVIRSEIPGTAPVTTLLDTNAVGTGSYFYRLSVD